MRGVFKVLLLLAAALAILLATLPWWLGVVLRPAAARNGVTYTAYERVGYGRFGLREVRLERGNILFTAQYVELNTPLLWLLRRANARADVRSWELTLLSPPREGAQLEKKNPSTPADVHAQLRQALAQLRTWLPQLQAREGAIRRGEQRFDVSALTWDSRTLVASAKLPSGEAVNLTFAPVGERFDFTVDSPAFAAGAQLAWTPDAIRGNGTWWQQPFTVAARFGPSGWIPAEAELRAPNWDLNAAQLRLGPSFSRVQSNVAVLWRDGAFTIEARAQASPTDRAQIPPLELVARASGDRTRVRVEELHLDAPFARATLSAPFDFQFDGTASGAPAALRLTADLARQNWIKATGRIEGDVELAPLTGQSQGRFALRLTEVAFDRALAQLVTLQGDWHWPRVTVKQLTAQLDDSSRLTARGELDWTRRELRDVRAEADIGLAWAQLWLPRGVTFDRATARVEADGPLEAPRHRGELHGSSVRASSLRPLELAANWEGQERALQDFSLTARSSEATLQAGGLLDERRVELRTLTLTRRSGEQLRSVAPAEIAWRPVLQVSGFRLEGGAHALAADFKMGDAPVFFLSAQNFSSAWLADWWEAPVLPSRVDRLTARGEVREGALAFEADLAAGAEWEGARLQARLTSQGDRRGVQIPNLEISDARGLMAYASGRVPAWIDWRVSPRLAFDEEAPLELDASVAPDSPLWSVLAEKARLELTGASLVASASGTLRNPRGVVRAEASRIARIDASELERAAAIADASVIVRAERDGLRLESLGARVAGQPIQATGRLPLNDAAWQTLLRQPGEFDWSRATGDFAADRIELTALAKTFPTLPFIAGVADARIRVERGELTGRAQLSGGETRPLPGLGRMLEVSADLALAGRQVEVREFAARLGGEPVRLTGRAELDRRGQPVLDLRLEGTNVPLVRRPGLLVRTNLDLRARTPERGPTVISGRVDLQDALLMADLAAILPGGPRGTARHPPYFAVEAEPFARWPLDVRIGGAKAVRARTAVFSGVATPNFHLTGTLGDPRAVGQLAVDEGRVMFPFASFSVQQGTVRLTEADPTQPQLAVNAVARRLGYELRLEAGGTIAAPTLAFSSNPPLESADILLLVTTGQPPAEETAAPTGTQRLTRLGTYLGRGIFQNFGGDEERLEITSGEQVSRAGRETYRVEYKLRDKLSLTGDYDEYDTYNAGIKYRIYTQEGTKREERK